MNTGADWSSLHCVGGDAFAIGHHFMPGERRFEVSVHRFSAPEVALARVVVAESGTAFEGEPQAWLTVPTLFVAHLSYAPWNDFVLVKVIPETRSVELQRLEWYDDSYDKGYQSVGPNVVATSQADIVAISVQRSSKLVLHDLSTGRARQFVELAGRHGNPKLVLNPSGDELWTTDYDTVVVVATTDWTVRPSAILQEAAAGTWQFIGEISLSPDNRFCVVARPFSGDVVAIDARTLEITSIVKLGREPLDVAVLPGGSIVARDWKTGDLLRGKLKRNWFSWW